METSTKKDKISDFIAKVKDVKHIKMIIVLLLFAIILLIVGSTYKNSTSFFSFRKSETTVAQATESAAVSYTATEIKLADILSELEGVGKTKVMITYTDDQSVLGVIVVAQGAENTLTEWKIRRAIQTAMHVDYQSINVYSMQ